MGKPIFMNKFTMKNERLLYARIYVEVDAAQPLKDHVKIVCEEGKIMKQKVLYDWQPQRCDLCLCFGHTNSQCPKHPKIMQVWRVKEKKGEHATVEKDDAASIFVEKHNANFGGGVPVTTDIHAENLTKNQFQIIANMGVMDNLCNGEEDNFAEDLGDIGGEEGTAAVTAVVENVEADVAVAVVGVNANRNPSAGNDTTVGDKVDCPTIAGNGTADGNNAVNISVNAAGPSHDADNSCTPISVEGISAALQNSTSQCGRNKNKRGKNVVKGLERPENLLNPSST